MKHYPLYSKPNAQCLEGVPYFSKFPSFPSTVQQPNEPPSTKKIEVYTIWLSRTRKRVAKDPQSN